MKKATKVRQLDPQVREKISLQGLLLIFLLAIALGAGGAYILSTFGQSLPILKSQSNKVRIGKVAGIFDKKRFPDKAEGILKEGGIEGEGNFHLERPGGESQNVYLTSSIVDLLQFVGKKVRVWGETFKGEKAGWLMDVGYIEVL
ncbi:hypothetical protein HYT33_03680 [Candidatus Roizmanbacteria bacterium]|nr:hypothetical protein [Candidatus Roizmanbacteria bacterium]